MAKRIFIANRDGEFLATIVEFFKKNSFEVVTEQKGDTAYHALTTAKQGFDLVVLSVDLAEMETIEICRQVKKDARFAKTTFMIGIGEETDLKPYQELGIKEFIDEPFDPDRLLRKYNVILNYGATVKDAKAKTPLEKFLPLIVIGIVCLIFIIFLIKLLT